MIDNTDTNTTLLDAPTDTKTGEDGTDTKTLLDTKPGDAVSDDPSKTKGPDDKKAEPGKADDKPVAKVVPEKYADPKVPETISLDPELKTKVETLAKEAGLTQEQFQKVYDLHAEAIQKNIDAMKAMTSEWAEETKKELGADYQKSLGIASKAIDRIFEDPKENKDFRDLMAITGLGNNRLLAKAFMFVGKQISEDKFIEGGPKPSDGSDKSIAQRMYPELPSEILVKS